MTVARYVKATLSTLPSARFAVGNCVAAGVHYFPLLSPFRGRIRVGRLVLFAHQTTNGFLPQDRPLAVRLSPRRSSFGGKRHR